MSQHPAPNKLPERRRIPLAAALVGGIALLIMISVGSVLLMSLRQASENTFSLLARYANANLDLLESRIGDKLNPVARAATKLGQRIGAGTYDINQPDQALEHLLRGSLAALPQATAASFVRADGEAVLLARVNGEIRPVFDDAVLRERQATALKQAAKSDKGEWVEPIWVQAIGQPVLSFIAPVKRDKKLFGVVIIPMRLATLADFLKDLEQRNGVRAVVLYDATYVLAHRDLLGRPYPVSKKPGEAALPKIAGFPEPSFRLLRPDAERAEALVRTKGISDAPVDDEFVLLLRNITKYGPKDWQIGLRYRVSNVSDELNRLRNMAIVGAVILLLAVLIGTLYARNLNRQIGNLANAADKLRRLDIADTPTLPDSRIREFSNAAQAFNAMVAAMHWFETYVPKTLVLRLMRAGGDQAVVSEEREMTVMFTDIRGFSTLAEHKTPAEIANLLNEHFETLSNVIEATGGTVDKFIGDAVMAFWGAPEPQADHAARALNAATDIRKAVHALNATHRKSGKPVVGIRVGLHSGPVIVGNIGSKARVNYTVVGDTVNVAARLEAQAKDLDDGSDDPKNECITLLSAAVLEAAGGDAATKYGLTPLGKTDVRGRVGAVDIYRL